MARFFPQFKKSLAQYSAKKVVTVVAVVVGAAAAVLERNAVTTLARESRSFVREWLDAPDDTQYFVEFTAKTVGERRASLTIEVDGTPIQHPSSRITQQTVGPQFHAKKQIFRPCREKYSIKLFASLSGGEGVQEIRAETPSEEYVLCSDLPKTVIADLYEVKPTPEGLVLTDRIVLTVAYTITQGP